MAFTGSSSGTPKFLANAKPSSSNVPPPEDNATIGNLPMTPSMKHLVAKEEVAALGKMTPTDGENRKGGDEGLKLLLAAADLIKSKEIKLELVDQTTERKPEWLPDGWSIHKKQRKSGASAGAIDTYYKHKEIRRTLRSKKEVLRYIENGEVTRRSRPKSGTNLLSDAGSTSHEEEEGNETED